MFNRFFIETPSEERLLNSENYQYVVDVGPGEFGITRADDIKPILATYGLATCVGFVGWNPKQKIGFLTHYDAMTKLSESFDYLIDCVLKQSQGKSSEFDVRLVGGWDNSDPIIEFLKSNLGKNKNIKMKLIKEDIGRSGLVKSVALDTRTGKTYSYFPKLNPFHTRTEENFDLFNHSIAKLTYQSRV
ncbi:MAG: hypothetical protein AABX99_01265 [Nanoarchaeota archaeon]